MAAVFTSDFADLAIKVNFFVCFVPNACTGDTTCRRNHYTFGTYAYLIRARFFYSWLQSCKLQGKAGRMVDWSQMLTDTNDRHHRANLAGNKFQTCS